MGTESIHDCICNSIFPGIVWLTFLHQHTHSQGFWCWLHGCHFPNDAVSAHISMSVCCIPTLSYSNMKLVTRNVQKVVWAITYIICWTSLQYKNSCNLYPLPFSEAWQPCTKGPSRSSILDSFWVLHHSTSINVVELFFYCTDVYWYIYW